MQILEASAVYEPTEIESADLVGKPIPAKDYYNRMRFGMDTGVQTQDQSGKVYRWTPQQLERISRRVSQRVLLLAPSISPRHDT